MVIDKWVVRYVAGAANQNIFYLKSNVNCAPLTAYAEADWEGCNDTRWYKIGIIVTLNRAPISLNTKVRRWLPSIQLRLNILKYQAGKMIYWICRGWELNSNTTNKLQRLTCHQMYYTLTDRKYRSSKIQNIGAQQVYWHQSTSYKTTCPIKIVSIEYYLIDTVFDWKSI